MRAGRRRGAQRHAAPAAAPVGPAPNRRRAPEPSASLMRQHARRDLGRQPARGCARIGGIDGQPLGQQLAGVGGLAASSRDCGHGASGLTWSGVTGDTPPQSLMPGADQPPIVAGRRGWAAPGCSCRRRRISRATAMVHSSSSRSGSGGVGHAASRAWRGNSG